MKKTLGMVALSLLVSGASAAQTHSVRATELSSSLWTELAARSGHEVVVEFRQGDELPVTFANEGDLLVTTHKAVSFVEVKKAFWLRLKGDLVQISLDGTIFKPISEVLKGSLTASAGSGDIGGPANAINVIFNAKLR